MKTQTTKSWAIYVLLSCLLCTNGCQAFKNYNDYLVEKSLASEIPTLIGNIIGGGLGVPFLLISTPIGYIAVDESEPEKYQEVVLAPVKAGAYTGGILLGTPFLPLAFIFPRNLPKETTETIETTEP